MKKKIISLLILVIVIFSLNYLWLVPLNIRYLSSLVIFILIIVIIFMIINPKGLISYKYIETFDLKGKKSFVKVPMITKNIGIGIFSFFIIVIMYGLFSSTMLFSKDYKNLIGAVEENVLDKNFLFDNIEDLPIIDNGVATILGDKKIGEDRGLGSEFRVGDFSDITYQNQPYSVAPLEFNDFFKWLGNKSTPGYVLVNKKTGETTLVRDLNGKDIKMKYMPSAYFNNDLLRHTYFNGNMDNTLASYHFEIDDEGNPYWILIKTHKTIGISGGDDVLSAITVNAVTGEVNEYNPSDAPSWIDIIYPSNLALKQLDDWGYYVNGFFNTLFSEKEIIRITNGSRHVYHDGQMYHYTGLTSAGADESTVGFAFVNTRTKETLFYTITGATEAAAMSSAEGKVQNLRYTSSFPIPVNIEEIPTFFMTLKDANGLIKQYAFVNINDYGKVGIGEDIQTARSNYLKLMNKDDVTSTLEEHSGIIKRIGYSNNNYYLLLENNEQLFYSDVEEINKILSLSKIGDNIKINTLNDSIKQVENITLGVK